MGGRMNEESTEDFQGSETIVFDTEIVATSQYMSFKTQCVPQNVNSNADYRIRFITMY